MEPANRKLIRPSLAEPPKVEAKMQRPPRPDVQKRSSPPDQTNAENFYYLKQMQSKTRMTIVLGDGETLHGVIEWYDKHCIKLNRASGQSNLLIYKASIRYMFKEGEVTK